MRRLTNYLFALVAVVAISCSKDVATPQSAGQTGTLKISFTATRAESEAYDPMDHYTLRIYNKEGELLRKYTSTEAQPEQLELLAGDYRAAVELGEVVDASFEKRYYTGEKTFTVIGGQTTPVEVVCNIHNTVIETKFDQTVGVAFGSAFHVWVVAADAFDQTAAEKGEVPALRYTTSTKGYFTLPEGQSTIAWYFEGEHPKRGTIVQQGTVENLKGGSRYVLTFKFSPDLPGFIDAIQITVDDKTDNWDDTFIFQPDPTIVGSGFDMTEVQKYSAGEKRFDISTIGRMKEVVLSLGESQYTLYGPSATTPAGIRTEVVDDRTLAVILSDELFSGLPAGNSNLGFHITDYEKGELRAYTTFRLQGMLPLRTGDCDLWNGTLKLRAMAFTDNEQMTFSIRKPDGTWRSVEATRDASQDADGEYIYTAPFASEWEASNNATGLAVHTLKAESSIGAATTYEGRATFGTVVSNTKITTPAGQAIPGGDMEDGSMSCFNNNHGSFWDSGNNSMAAGLCSQSSFLGQQGSKCAKMSASKPIALVNLAAGNLFTGTFSMSGTSGKVDFGKSYAWEARPRALSVKYYAEQLGNVNVNQHGGPLANGTQDKARIFVAIVDWSSTHQVVSGSSKPSGVWDPATVTTVGAGKIIAYGSLFIDKQSTGEQMIDVELPIYYYDQITKPSSTYTLVISCATSAYGDYMNGNTSNILLVDDFKWVY